jgi:rhodanese-related sulfurtransferase
MGPFVPDLISDQLNLIVALIIGIAFGFVLEQAGFSSSRRLAGLFYGYDFTVLRVFFTAAITAALGILLLGTAGLLDTDLIYVNPTWLLPAIAGGVIMGVGFVIGGYCPGTSICAAAIGKVDAVFFIGGGAVGVLVFGELYPFHEAFTNGTALGPLKVSDALGVSQGAFLLGLIVVAVAAFAVTTKIERAVNPAPPSAGFRIGKHALGAAGVIALGAAVAVLPGRKDRVLGAVDDPEYVRTHPVTMMPVDELAFRVIDRDPALQVIDVREGAPAAMIPGAVAVPLPELFSKEWEVIFSRRHRKKVFIAEDESTERRACLLAGELGYENLAILEGGLSAFRKTIIDRSVPMDSLTAARAPETARFRAMAGKRVAELLEEQKAAGAKKPAVTKKISGGC